MLEQQCSNQAAMRVIKVHTEHTNRSGHVLGQYGQIENVENPWQIQSNFNKLHALTESIWDTRWHFNPQVPCRAVSQLEQTVHLSAHRNTFQSHLCCPSITKSLLQYSKVRIIATWEVMILSSLYLRPPYPLNSQMHEVYI